VAQTSSEIISAHLANAVDLDTLSGIADRASEFAHDSKAANTVRAYRADWSHFVEWCTGHQQVTLPASPDTVALYIADLAATHKPSTLTRRISAISQAHQIAGFESPVHAAKVRAVMAGIRRSKGTAAEAKTPVLVEDLKRMLTHVPEGLLGVRDRALLLVGFAGAFRRSELVGLDHGDVEFARDGLVVRIRKSKTDQDGEGRKIGIPYGSNPITCPIRSLQDWLEKSGLTEGALFRPINRHGKMAEARLSSAAVADVVKRYAGAVGLHVAEFAGHSLRAGLATSAAMAGASERAIMNQTGHRSVVMVRRYIREGSLFRENAASVLGL